jgi:hypothetical protein
VDNARQPPPLQAFGPDRRLAALYAFLVLVGAAAAWLTPDPAGRLLFAGAAIVLLAYLITDLVYWPRLIVTADGLVIHTPTVRGRYPWDAVRFVRADARRRAGLRLVTLEVDVADELVVFSRRSLGTDPEDAARAIAAADPRGLS